MTLDDLPITYRATIPPDYLDEMGHMNVMWYTHLFGCATMGLFERIGLTREYFEANHAGSFALEHHVRYLAEVRVGQQVTLRSRALDRSAKRLHFMMSQNDSLKIDFKEFTLGVDEKSIVGKAVLTGRPINIPDLYKLDCHPGRHVLASVHAKCQYETPRSAFSRKRCSSTSFLID